MNFSRRVLNLVYSSRLHEPDHLDPVSDKHLVAFLQRDKLHIRVAGRTKGHSPRKFSLDESFVDRRARDFVIFKLLHFPYTYVDSFLRSIVRVTSKL